MRRAGLSATLRVVAVAVVAALAASGCGVLGGRDGYEVVAWFPRATSLYAGSQVSVMGVEVGTIDDVGIEGDLIRVEMTIDDDVPLPADVGAAIVPLTLIGERNVVLFPPWQPGDGRFADGAEIPVERTRVPVEADEALQAFTDLAEAVDPDAVARLVSGAAQDLEGQGEAFGQGLEDIAGFTSLLASQDDRLLDVAADLNTLARTLNSREDQLGAALDAFGEVTEVVAAERESIASLLQGVVRLSDEGQALVDAYGDRLPGDVALLAETLGVVATNVGSVSQTVEAFAVINQGLIGAFDEERNSTLLRFNVSGSAIEVLGVLEPLLAQLGVPVPCISLLGDLACP